jgi:hypothetical protein
MKSYAAIVLLALGANSALAQQPQPAAVPVTEQQQVLQQQQVQQQTQEAGAVAVQPQPVAPPQPAHVVLRVVGSQVRNPSGERLGLIEEVLVSRANGAVEFAIVSPQYPTNSARQIPIPWGALSHAWDQSRAGGPPGANQVFIVNADSRRLALAPTLERTRTAATMDQTLANAGTFFGQTQPAGAAGGTVGTVSGAVADPGTATTAPVGGGTIVQPGDNQVVIPGQPSTVPPGGNSRVPPPEQRVPFPNNNTVTPGAGAQSPGTPVQPSAPAQGGTRPATGGTTGGSKGSGGASTGGGTSGGSAGGAGGAAGR